MKSEFEELNQLAYESLRSGVLDLLIWCLGPYVDDRKSYGALRILLARFTRAVLRPWCNAPRS